MNKTQIRVPRRGRPVTIYVNGVAKKYHTRNKLSVDMICRMALGMQDDVDPSKFKVTYEMHGRPVTIKQRTRLARLHLKFEEGSKFIVEKVTP